MPKSLTVQTATGEASAVALTIGTASGNAAWVAAWIGVAGGGVAQFWPAVAFTATIVCPDALLAVPAGSSPTHTWSDISVTTTGATGPLTYEWSIILNDGRTPVLTGATTANPTVSGHTGSDVVLSITLGVIVTDEGAGGATAEASINLSYDVED
jgi:hypothetical protein